MRIIADRERCIGAGMCALIAPEIFDQDEDDGRVRLLDRSPRHGHAAVREALDTCPSRALALDEPRE
ncbi:ferredoxin [Nocardia uniformis]|uniref:Ferredoxin n=1 Tax=Nocardia uniformis TaxID=53432 RepID=A0A849BY62_9NOCA|nr:ferredoxin [Nocardia uniformis]NNH71462.1 ferredoxin [Nocardia uniformis]